MLCVIGLITYSGERETQQAQQKAIIVDRKVLQGEALFLENYAEAAR